MKFASILALAGAVAAKHTSHSSHETHHEEPKHEPVPEPEPVEVDDDVWTSEDLAQYRIAGIKGFHEGFNKAFYKTRTADDDCLDDATVDNIAIFTGMVMHPADALSNITDVANDFNLFAEGAEVLENFSGCHFEGPAIEIMSFCSANPDACAITALMENLTKNLVILIGKLSGIAEIFGEIPAETIEDNHDIFMQIGDTLGTLVRTFFNFHSDERDLY